MRIRLTSLIVAPAKAGAQTQAELASRLLEAGEWIPAYAGMTEGVTHG